MNKTYRIVWNKARNCLMVVGENAKSQGKGAGNKKPLVNAVTAALLALGGSNAVADDITITGTVTTTQTLRSGQSILVDGSGTNTGSIDTDSNAAILVPIGTSAVAITNSGSILGLTYGIYARSSTLTGGITNTGTISGSSGGIFANQSTLTGGINNSDSISVGSGGFAGIAAGASTLTGGITNSGTISGGYYGIYANSSTLTGGINNSGMISGGLYGIHATQSSLEDGITNSGSISGSYGIVLDSSSTLTGGITNSGSISGRFAGIGVSQSTLSGGINNSGSISGVSYGIFATLSTLTGGITNSGLISGGTYGIRATLSTLTGGITNSGLISGRYGIYAKQSTLTGGITNSDSISGGSGGIYAYASILEDGITNSGSISGGYYGGIYASLSTLTGGITNSGLISGTSVAGILLTRSSTLTGGINNSGTISGGIDGIGLRSSTLEGGITNAGLIQGTEYAIYAGQSSSVSGGILVTGTSAQFIGDIYAPNVDLTLASDAKFTNSNAMSLNGVIVSSRATFNLTNAASASSSLSGNINVGNGTGYFTNQGTVDVGSRGASATPTITGNYTQDAGGTFKTTVVSDTEYGQMRVTGSATLAGAAEVAMLGASTLTKGSTLGEVITASTMTGQFSSIGLSSSIHSYTGVYTATAFGLVYAGPKPDAVANNNAQYGTPAAAGAAGALDQIATDPGAMAPVINALDGMSGQTQADAVAQKLPAVVGASSMAAAQNHRAVNQVIQARQAQIAGLSSGADFAGNRDVWAKGFGNWANQGDLNNVAGYSVDGGGVAIGFDKQLSLKSNLGISLAYAYSSVSSNSAVAPSSVDINSYQLGLYGDYQLQPDLQLTYQLDGAINTNASTRSLSSFAGTTGVGSNATGTYNSYVVHAGLGLKKFFSLNPNTRLTPEVRVDYTTVQTDAYTESGGGLLNLKVNSQSYETLYTSASLRVDHTLSNGLDISANIGVAYNALDNNAQLTSAYQGGGPAFVTNGLEISPWLYNAGVGIGGMVSKDVELNVRYDIDFSSTSYTNQMVSARVKVLF